MQIFTSSRTNGLVGISVLALFAIAIIAGQARGDLHNLNSVDRDLPTAIDLGILIESDAPAGFEVGYEAIRKFKVSPVMVDFGIEMVNPAVDDRVQGPRTSF